MRRLFLGLFALLLILLGACYGWLAEQRQHQEVVVAAAPAAAATSTRPLLDCHYFDRSWWQRNTAAATIYPSQGRLRAATLPHYVPAMSLAASVLATAAQSGTYDTIVILGPNHSGVGPPVVVGDQGWRTPLGEMAGEPYWGEVLLQTVNLEQAARQDGLMTEEWSAATVVPYVQHYFPDAKVVTLLLSRSAELYQLEALAGLLQRWGEEQNLLVLASIDFSHDQTYERAVANDETVQTMVAEANYTGLLGLDGAYLDCPQALVTLLLWGKNQGYAPQLWQELIQRDQGAKAACGYSYLVYAWEEQP